MWFIHIVLFVCSIKSHVYSEDSPHLLCYFVNDHLKCAPEIHQYHRRRLGLENNINNNQRILSGVQDYDDQLTSDTFLLPTEDRVPSPILNKVIKIKRLVRKKINNLLAPLPPPPLNNTLPPAQDPILSLATQARSKLAKFLSLFTVINFNNEGCMTNEGLKGTCYHNLECRSLGGTPSGLCAAGYGVCCLFTRTCGERTANNCTYFENPPTTLSGGSLGCLLTVEKASPDVTQLRLELVNFELEQPTNGTCITEQFVVTGQNGNSIVPVLCGSNSGQHVYVDVSRNDGPYQLSVIRSGSSGTTPRFRIKVTQVRRGDDLEAPANCLQYYMGPSGQFSSFNYFEEGGNGYINNNVNYAICFRKENGFCTITYTNERNGQEFPFQITNLAGGEVLVPPGQAGAEIFNCPDSYIIVNGIRLCGEKFNDVSRFRFHTKCTSYRYEQRTFILPVRLAGETNGRGFKLDFQQNPCSSV